MRNLKLFLRLALGAGFLSAVADRLGCYPAAVSAWGNWENFLAYTELINPLVPKGLIPALGGIATVAEILLGAFLLLGFKTEQTAKLSGVLILLFGIAISFSTGFKGALDYSVFAAAGAAFALGTMRGKYLELDLLFTQNEPLNTN